MDYNAHLANQFKDLKINLVKHDTSPTGCPTYIEVQLGKTPKDKGTTALDLSNYLYRMGLKFQTIPEYLGRGKKTTLRFYMSWDDISPLLNNIRAAVDPTSKIRDARHLPVSFRSLIIQDTSRGCHPKYEDC